MRQVSTGNGWRPRQTVAASHRGGSGSSFIPINNQGGVPPAGVQVVPLSSVRCSSPPPASCLSCPPRSKPSPSIVMRAVAHHSATLAVAGEVAQRCTATPRELSTGNTPVVETEICEPRGSGPGTPVRTETPGHKREQLGSRTEEKFLQLPGMSEARLLERIAAIEVEIQDIKHSRVLLDDATTKKVFSQAEVNKQILEAATSAAVDAVGKSSADQNELLEMTLHEVSGSLSAQLWQEMAAIEERQNKKLQALVQQAYTGLARDSEACQTVLESRGQELAQLRIEMMEMRPNHCESLATAAPPAPDGADNDIKVLKEQMEATVKEVASVRELLLMRLQDSAVRCDTQCKQVKAALDEQLQVENEARLGGEAALREQLMTIDQSNRDHLQEFASVLRQENVSRDAALTELAERMDLTKGCEHAKLQDELRKEIQEIIGQVEALQKPPQLPGIDALRESLFTEVMSTEARLRQQLVAQQSALQEVSEALEATANHCQHLAAEVSMEQDKSGTLSAALQQIAALQDQVQSITQGQSHSAGASADLEVMFQKINLQDERITSSLQELAELFLAELSAVRTLVDEKHNVLHKEVLNRCSTSKAQFHQFDNVPPCTS